MWNLHKDPNGNYYLETAEKRNLGPAALSDGSVIVVLDPSRTVADIIREVEDADRLYPAASTAA